MPVLTSRISMYSEPWTKSGSLALMRFMTSSFPLALTMAAPRSAMSIATARQWQWMSPELQEAVQVISHVLPFRTNEYVMEHLIDWSNVPDDPIYRLTFPHRDMLPAKEYEQLRDLVLYKKDDAAIAK